MAEKPWEPTDEELMAVDSLGRDKGFLEHLYDEMDAEGRKVLLGYQRRLTEAVQRTFYRWERQNCNEHPQREDGKGEPYYLSRRFCPECQQALQQGMEGERT